MPAQASSTIGGPDFAGFGSVQSGRFPRPWRRTAGGALLSLAAWFACVTALAAPAQVPPLVQPASHERHVGKVVFVELVTPDLAAAQRFYGSLFGWTFSELQAGALRYAAAYLNGNVVAGIVQKPIPPDQQRQPAWLSFLSVRDVDAASKMAVERGAKLLLQPRTVPGRGREAVLADPQGAIFAILASSSGDPPDALVPPGAWIWSTLSARDPDTDAAFYQALFDYEVFDLPADVGFQHLMLASENYARASANTLPPDHPGAHSHWLNYVRVADAEAAATRLMALGGHVLIAPRLDRHGGKLAVVSDPQGAVFGLMEWPGADMTEVAE